MQKRVQGNRLLRKKIMGKTTTTKTKKMKRYRVEIGGQRTDFNSLFDARQWTKKLMDAEVFWVSQEVVEVDE